MKDTGSGRKEWTVEELKGEGTKERDIEIIFGMALEVANDVKRRINVRAAVRVLCDVWWPKDFNPCPASHNIRPFPCLQSGKSSHVYQNTVAIFFLMEWKANNTRYRILLGIDEMSVMGRVHNINYLVPQGS